MRGPGRAARRQHRHPVPVTPARKQVLLRLDPQVYEALARWAGEELRSANAQIEFLLRRALSDAGRLPSAAGPIPRRGRPARDAERAAEHAAEQSAPRPGTRARPTGPPPPPREGP
ncbi:hypothetical protein ACN20G_07925 [Streptomyces sp. BI20]|uniref:hypothetical protein n=1 Tax=Streptomyces sp. BI20 TaxID=3403460 RepID=UPI003C771E9E